MLPGDVRIPLIPIHHVAAIAKRIVMNEKMINAYFISAIVGVTEEKYKDTIVGRLFDDSKSPEYQKLIEEVEKYRIAFWKIEE